jgi:8-oxo-dGTP pyrophosphatase MutT (NUDIX family)
MHRNNLRALLAAYNPSNSAEQHYKVRILAFIDENQDCFERSLAIGHITASAWLLSKDHSHALLMHHAKLNKWVQVGGHCDGDADVLAVACKEAQEESGITQIAPVESTIFDIDIHLIPANSRELEHYHYDVRFLCAVRSDETIQRNNESKELRWFGKEDPLPTTEESVMRMHAKWMARL